jgi:type I restriction enzyme, S subunit
MVAAPVTEAAQEAEPSGFKQTEIGPIPGDWEVVALGDVSSFSNGLPLEHTVGATGYSKLITLDSIGIDGELKENHRLSYYCDEHLIKGDIVTVLSDLAHGNLLGLSALVPSNNQFVLNQRMGRLRCLHGVCSAYVRLQINYRQDHFRVRGQGTSQKHIYKRDFDCLLIPLPPLAEQEAIAGALSDADGAIRAVERALAKQRAVKQAALHALLTPTTRLPGFSGDWETKTLGELGTFLKGSGVRKDEAQSGSIPCVRYGELYTDHHDVIRAFRSRISSGVASKATRLRYGDILFAGSGETKEEIGKSVAFAEKIEAFAGGDIVILRVYDAEPVFLGYAPNMPAIQRQKASKGQGDAVVHISSAALATISISLPPLPEQRAIAAVLSDMDAAIAAQEARRDKLKAVKQGMMQTLLTGKVRLV